MTVVLRPISDAAATAIIEGRHPEGVRVAADYPTEFSTGVASRVGAGSPLGPFFIHRGDDDVVIGEIGGGFTSPGVIEIGYAIVPSAWGQGHATAAVRTLLAIARELPEIELVVGHTPLDRPASGRVLEKAGFQLTGEIEDEHEGVPIRVKRWELPAHAAPARPA